MEPDEDSKKLNDEFVEFIRKQSDTKAPRYTAKLRTYVDYQRKRERASAARRNYENGHEKTLTASRKKGDDDIKDKSLENSERPGDDKDRDRRGSRRVLKSAGADTSEGSFRARASSAPSDIEVDPFSNEPFLGATLRPCSMRDGKKCMTRTRSMSLVRSEEPSDGCGMRRRRRRKRSCGRRRRRRRSCGRRRRRRRRRSCGRRSRRRRSRRRRRRSCCRRRRVRRRRRC